MNRTREDHYMPVLCDPQQKCGDDTRYYAHVRLIASYSHYAGLRLVHDVDIVNNLLWMEKCSFNIQVAVP